MQDTKAIKATFERLYLLVESNSYLIDSNIVDICSNVKRLAFSNFLRKQVLD